jgi:hypothetical protein
MRYANVVKIPFSKMLISLLLSGSERHTMFDNHHYRYFHVAVIATRILNGQGLEW